jgi:hypothetical protein
MEEPLACLTMATTARGTSNRRRTRQASRKTHLAKGERNAGILYSQKHSKTTTRVRQGDLLFNGYKQMQKGTDAHSSRTCPYLLFNFALLESRFALHRNA